MKSLLLATIVALGIATTPTLAAEKKGLVRVSYLGQVVKVPIGIAAQVCPSVSAKDIAHNRTGIICVLHHQSRNKAFLNYVHNTKS
jgi:hypothetical protein